MSGERREPITFFDACQVIVAKGYTPVDTVRNRRIRAWLDFNGWPPTDWVPPAQSEPGSAA